MSETGSSGRSRGSGRGGGGRGGRSRGRGGGRNAAAGGRGRGGRGTAPREGDATAGGGGVSRGRGRGTGGRKGSSNAGRGGGQPQQTTTPAAMPAPRNKKAGPSKQLQNGEKGAEAHTVSEADRIRFTKILMQLREGDESRLEFPANLTNTERKFVHQLASQLGLVSKSTGKGDDRRIAVTKRAEQNKKATANEDDSMPVLQIGKQGIQALTRHLSKFPPTHSEDLESKETGSSMVEAYTSKISDDDGGDNIGAHDARIAATLKQLGLGQEERVAMAAVKPKYVNLDHRRARHSAFQSAKLKSPQYPRMIQQRKRLPAFVRQEEIVATVASHPVTIIQGETGCGKSTQCPQFLLDANPTANIVVTQRE